MMILPFRETCELTNLINMESEIIKVMKRIRTILRLEFTILSFLTEQLLPVHCPCSCCLVYIDLTEAKTDIAGSSEVTRMQLLSSTCSDECQNVNFCEAVACVFWNVGSNGIFQICLLNYSHPHIFGFCDAIFFIIMLYHYIYPSLQGCVNNHQKESLQTVIKSRPTPFQLCLFLFC